MEGFCELEVHTSPQEKKTVFGFCDHLQQTLSCNVIGQELADLMLSLSLKERHE